MRNKIIFGLSGAGLLVALISAWLFARHPTAQAPVFSPAANPYAHGIYANGIVESDQSEGQNINMYPEVAGPISRVLVVEGQVVHQGDPLLRIDDAVQRAAADQQEAQAQAALALLQELKRQPRPENLAVAAAQVDSAQATLKSAQDTHAKLQQAFQVDPRAVSREALDSARDTEAMAVSALGVVQKQFELTRAGAWTYDIESQQHQYEALSKAAQASRALLDKYLLRAPSDGVVLALRASIGSYVSPQGAYDSYTQAFAPLIVMGRPQRHLAVRAFVDEILIHELPDRGQIQAQMFIRGTHQQVPLAFLRIQPLVSPKIELSDARAERVDLRVLPLVFRFENTSGLNLYPGQLVDVYISGK